MTESDTTGMRAVLPWQYRRRQRFLPFLSAIILSHPRQARVLWREASGVGGLALSRAIAILACSASVGGCASIFEGTTQQISVSTTPPGARCTFWRNGTLIADVPVTPGAATIDKTKDELLIICSKPGYAATTFVNKSGLAMATFANILTAGLAWAVDSSRGADNKYQGDVNLSLAPAGTAAPVEGPMPEPRPEPVPFVPQARGGAPAQAPAVVTPATAPAAPQIECMASDGSRISVTGAACPAGWTPAR